VKIGRFHSRSDNVVHPAEGCRGVAEIEGDPPASIQDPSLDLFVGQPRMGTP